MMQEAIFESAGQAVHVAFAIMGQEASQGAPLQRMLIRAMEQTPLETPQQRHWLDQLRSRPSGTVNFAGLTSSDIRAQCAMITRAVENLPDLERWVLQAKYGQTDYEDVGDGSGGTARRFAFSQERIVAIKGLSDWLAPGFPRIKSLALDCMLGRLYANHSKIDISARDLAEQFGRSHTTYVRAAYKMKNQLRKLEEGAIALLEPLFADQGVSCRS